MKIRNLAGCVITDENNAILLLLRNRPGRVQWELPGGKQDPGETLQQTATRELKEELGVTVDDLKPVGHGDFEFEDAHWRYHWYRANIQQDQEPKIIETDKFDELKYWSIADINKHSKLMSANVINLLRILNKLFFD